MMLFDASMPFFKGNTHMHTTCSDGRWTPEQAKAAYKAAGYDFIAITDHRMVGPGEDYHGMLVLPGAEYDYTFDTQVLHVVAVLPDERLGQQDWTQWDHNAMIDQINAHGGAAIVAHPAWSLNTTDFMKSLGEVCGAEVFNTFSGIPWNVDRADSAILLDVLCANGRRMNFVAADDSHRYTGEQCRSYIMVQAEACTPEAIIAAMKAGRFYASQGPRFESVEMTSDRIVICTSPVSRITFFSNLPWVAERTRTGDGMVEHEYRFETDHGEKWIRCEICDEEGRKAWLSPVAL